MDTLLIEVLRGEPSASDRRVIGGLGDRSRVAKSKGSLRPTMDPLPARELFASSRVLGALQRECLDVARRVHELMQVGSPEGQLIDRITADCRESRADQVVRALTLTLTLPLTLALALTLTLTRRAPPPTRPPSCACAACSRPSCAAPARSAPRRRRATRATAR